MPPSFYPFPLSPNERLATPMVSKLLFNPAFCDKLVDNLQPDKWEEGLIAKGHEQPDKKVRSCLQQNCPFIPQENFPYHWLAQAVAKINSEVWRFDLEGLDLKKDPPIVLRYQSAREDFYQWHVDYWSEQCHRKLSFVVQLSEEQDYEGGELLFFPEGSLTAPKQRGSLIVFPTYIPHKVTPVTRGERKVLVGWVHGPCFR